MPELPDVEYLREYAEATSLHKEVASTSLNDASLLENTSAQLLARRLKGAQFDAARRHGKHLFLRLAARPDSAQALMLHFGMTGTLRSYSSSTDGTPPEYTALELRFSDGTALACVNKRRLGQIAIVEDIDAYVREQELGPDALSVTRDQLAAIIHDGRGAVKSTLMNQSRLAGLGNIYTDEVLFQSRVDPRLNCGEITDSQLRAIHEQIRRVCKEAIGAHAEPQAMPDSFLIHRREPGAECPRCGGTVKKVTVSGRSAYLCESCQG